MKCQYCGSQAGWFRRYHSECKQKKIDGRNRMLNLVMEDAINGGYLSDRLPEIAAETFNSEELGDAIYVEGWERAAEKYISEGGVLSDREDNLIRFAQGLAMVSVPDLLSTSRTYTKLLMMSVLGDLAKNSYPRWSNTLGSERLVMKKGEKPIWVFQNVPYYEEKVSHTWESRSSGVVTAQPGASALCPCNVSRIA